MVAGVCRRRLSSSVTPAHMQRNSPGAARDGGPVVLRPVRATPSFVSGRYYFTARCPAPRLARGQYVIVFDRDRELNSHFLNRSSIITHFYFYRCKRRKMLVDCFQLVYHGLQLGAFTVMAAVFMRLKLFWTPQMCLMTSPLASKQVRCGVDN